MSCLPQNLQRTPASSMRACFLRPHRHGIAARAAIGLVVLATDQTMDKSSALLPLEGIGIYCTRVSTTPTSVKPCAPSEPYRAGRGTHSAGLPSTSSASAARRRR